MRHTSGSDNTGEQQRKRQDEWFWQQGQEFDTSAMLGGWVAWQRGSPQDSSKPGQTPWPCWLLHLLIKEVRDGMIKINSYNLTFLFKSLISNVFPTYFFPEFLASSKIIWVWIPSTFGGITVKCKQQRRKKKQTKQTWLSPTRFSSSHTIKS